MTPILRIPFERLAWVLPAAFALHEAEEWNILAWYRAHFVNPPSLTPRAVWTGLFFISLLGFAWTALSCLPRSPRVTAHLLLPFFIVFVCGNALQHVYFQLAFASYAPGFFASLFLNLPLTALVAWHAVRNSLVSAWYVAALWCLAFLVLGTAARAGHSVPPALQRVHAFIGWLDERLWGAA